MKHKIKWIFPPVEIYIILIQSYIEEQVIFR